MSDGRHPLGRLLSHLKHHQFTVLLASLCSILNKFWDLAPPILIGMALGVLFGLLYPATPALVNLGSFFSMRLIS